MKIDLLFAVVGVVLAGSFAAVLADRQDHNCVALQNCQEDANFALFYEKKESNDESFLKMSLLSGEEGTNQLWVAGNYQKELMIEGLLIIICGSDGHHFMTSTIPTYMVISTCRKSNDSVFLYNFKIEYDLFLPISINYTNSVITFRYFLLDNSSYYHSAFISLDILKHSSMQSPQSTTQDDEDGRILQKRNAAEEGYLIVTSEHMIQRFSLDGLQSCVLASNLNNTYAIDYHYRENVMYWTDINTHSIMSSNLDGSFITAVLTVGLDKPEGIAVDWVNNKLYFTDRSLDIVGVFDPISSYYTVLIETGQLSEPRAIVLDPEKRVMYWTDWGSETIKAASMDGRNQRVLHNKGLKWPNALALDLPSQTLYWADAFYNRVERSGVNGSQREIVYIGYKIFHPFGIGITNNGIYLTNASSILYVSGEGNSTLTFPSLRPSIVIRIVDESYQPLSSNPCESNNGECSYLCLLSTESNGYTCACPDGMNFTDYLNTTSAVLEPETLIPEVDPCDFYNGGCRDLCLLSAEDLKDSPTIVEIYGQSQLNELNELSLQCIVVRYNLTLEIVWLKRKGSEVTIILNTTRTSIASQYNANITSTLHIHRVIPSDQGEFICLAKFNETAFGYATKIIEVTGSNDCAVSPCLNGGHCIDLVGGYGCMCTEGFFGSNCGTPSNMQDVQLELLTTIEVDLESPVNLTCGAIDSPILNYEWFKDGVLIPGESKPFLHIQEMRPEDRGNYTCKATNERGRAESHPIWLIIPGVFVYSFNIENLDYRNLQDVLFLNTQLSVYSMEILNNTNSMLLVTIYGNYRTPVEALRQSLLSRLQIISSINISSMQRFDGCEEGNFGGFEWPETELGVHASVECPCSEFVGSMAGMAFLLCDGSYTRGAYWSNEVNTSECEVNRSELTNQLCGAAENAVNFATEVAAKVANITTNSSQLRAIDISVAVSVFDQLTSEAVSNETVRDNYLQIVDNIQQADPESVFLSQTSERVLRSLETFSESLDLVALSNNTSEKYAIFGFEKYALHLQDIDLNRFRGQTLSVNLGPVLKAMKSDGAIEKESLKISELISVLENTTASVSIPEDFFNQNRIKAATNLTCNDTQMRLSYSLFLTDILFQSINQTIASVILSVTLRCFTNDSLDASPLKITLLTNSEILDEKEKNTTSNNTRKREMPTENETPNYSCGKWKKEFGAWSDSDCKVVRKHGNQIECECAQLGHFGILFDLNPSSPPPDVALALYLFTYIGIMLSLFCLTALIISHLCSKKLRNNTHSQILINLSLSLAGLYIFFLIGGYVTAFPVLCGFSAALLHYFMLVFFTWTAVEAIWLYIKLVKIINIQSYESRYILKSGIPTWTIPLVIVSICVGSGHHYYISKYFCRVIQWPFWFGFLLPFTLLYIFDWIMYIIILTSVYKNRHKSSKMMELSSSKKFNIKEHLKNIVIAVTLAIVFGLGWGLGLLSTSYPVEELTWTIQFIFSLFVGTQGILLFTLHGICNSDVRNFWKQLITSFVRKTKISSLIAKSKNFSMNTESANMSETANSLPMKDQIVDLSNMKENQ